MKVALISDIHDRTNNLLAALYMARRERCEHLLCMGDFASLETFRLLIAEWDGSIDAVFGNNEYDRQSFLMMAQRAPNVELHGDVGSIDLDGKRIAMTHYPSQAMKLAESGRYDAVFFGHTHEAESFRLGKCLVVNPGELQGRRKAGFAVYDTDDDSVRFLFL